MKPTFVNGIEISEERIRQRLVELEERRASLARDLSSKRFQNMSAWNAYGSELSAGQMLDEEQGINDEIERIQNDIHALGIILQDNANSRISDVDVENLSREEVVLVSNARVAREKLANHIRFVSRQRRLRSIIADGIGAQ